MTLPQAVILGAVQGIAEFLPISSSGHLVIIQGIFHMKEPQLAFDIFLHLGTLASIFIYFRKEILSLFSRDKLLAFHIVVASIPTFIIGFLLKDAVEELFSRPHIVGYMLIVTGLLLIAATLYNRLNRAKPRERIGIINSLIVGVAQGIAVIPGISRSGATIGAGILSGIDKEKAFRFSFLLAIPAILGANLLKCGNIGAGFVSGDCLYLLSGAFVAMIVGLVSIGLLLRVVKTNRLYLFGIYCILAASLIITLL